MLRKLLLFLALLLPQVAPAQILVNGVPPYDLSGYVKTVNGTTPDTGGNVAIATTNFVSGFTSASPGTVANLMATAPCNSGRLASYAVVQDLYSNVAGASTNEVLRCGQTGTNYYWRPQRTDAAAALAYTGGAMTLSPLLTPPIVYLNNNMAANGTITPSTTYAYCGQQFTVVTTGVVGLFSIQIGGLLGNALSILTGGTRTLTYTCPQGGPNGWQGQ